MRPHSSSMARCPHPARATAPRRRPCSSSTPAASPGVAAHPACPPMAAPQRHLRRDTNAKCHRRRAAHPSWRPSLPRPRRATARLPPRRESPLWCHIRCRRSSGSPDLASAGYLCCLLSLLVDASFLPGMARSGDVVLWNGRIHRRRPPCYKAANAESFQSLEEVPRNLSPEELEPELKILGIRRDWLL